MTIERHAGFREACQELNPTRPDYAYHPVEYGFDWTSLASHDFEALYLVVFRSVRRPDADHALLKEHDDRAYATARRTGGLLRYFRGELGEDRTCLSFCLWESREEARRAAEAGEHRAAAEIVGEAYESYRLERYRLTNAGGKLVFSTLDG